MTRYLIGVLIAASLVVACDDGSTSGGGFNAIDATGGMLPDMATDADMDPAEDLGVEPDVGVTLDLGSDPDLGAEWATLEVVEGHEHDVGGNWLSAGQPSEDRVRALVALGARIISLRYPQEDPFDEPAVVESLGGIYTRYPVRSAQYEDPEFREALYDIYDAHMAWGGPVYLHCASANRAGTSWALYQAERVGVDPEEAIQLGQAAGMRGDAAVRAILGLD